jgi:integrase
MTRLELLVEESRKLAPHTKREYRAAVRSFVQVAGATPDLRFWTPRAVEAWVTAMQRRGLAPQTINTRLAGLKWASRRHAAVDGGVDFAAPIEGVRMGDQVRPQHSLTQAEVDRLYATCAGDTWADLRDRTIIALGVRAGLRREEIAKLEWAGLAGARLTFKAKGQRTDSVMLDAVTRELLTRWRRRCGNPPEGRILLSARGPRRQGLSAQGVYHIIKSRAAIAGVAELTPHTLRHTCASLLLAAGVSPWRVGLHLRHRDLKTLGKTYMHDIAADEGAPVGDVLPTPETFA